MAHLDFIQRSTGEGQDLSTAALRRAFLRHGGSQGIAEMATAGRTPDGDISVRRQPFVPDALPTGPATISVPGPLWYPGGPPSNQPVGRGGIRDTRERGREHQGRIPLTTPWGFALPPSSVTGWTAARTPGVHTRSMFMADFETAGPVRLTGDMNIVGGISRAANEILTGRQESISASAARTPGGVLQRSLDFIVPGHTAAALAASPLNRLPCVPPGYARRIAREIKRGRMSCL
jgi:hypothetical protein